jgi:hypothetical protein
MSVLLVCSFHWNTSEPAALERLHNWLVEALGKELSLSELRGIADIAVRFMPVGMPFVPEDAPLPATLKQISKYVKRII